MAHPDRFLLAGVMGWPVMHSRSPMLHNYWFKQHDLAGTYVPLAIRPESLAAALRALRPLGFAGCNLTIPHKQQAMTIVDDVDALARSIGAISCVVVRPDGALAGTNAVCYGLAREGAKEIRLLNRTFARAKGIADEFGGPIKALPWEQRHEALEGAAMVVNTTSCGMVGQPLLDIKLDKLPKSALAADIIYIPLETPFLAAARRRGNRTVNGLGMLLNQGRPAWKAWFGIEPEVTAELRAMVERTI